MTTYWLLGSADLTATPDGDLLCVRQPDPDLVPDLEPDEVTRLDPEPKVEALHNKDPPVAAWGPPPKIEDLLGNNQSVKDQNVGVEEGKLLKKDLFDEANKTHYMPPPDVIRVENGGGKPGFNASKEPEGTATTSAAAKMSIVSKKTSSDSGYTGDAATAGIGGGAAAFVQVDE